jgi:hypothetical protein
MDEPLTQIHLVPPEAAELGDAKPMAIGQENHRGIAMPVASTASGGAHQEFHFSDCEVFTWPQALIRLAFRRDCPILSFWKGEPHLVRTRLRPHLFSSNCPV